MVFLRCCCGVWVCFVLLCWFVGFLFVGVVVMLGVVGRKVGLDLIG